LVLFLFFSLQKLEIKKSKEKKKKGNLLAFKSQTFIIPLDPPDINKLFV